MSRSLAFATYLAEFLTGKGIHARAMDFDGAVTVSTSLVNFRVIDPGHADAPHLSAPLLRPIALGHTNYGDTLLVGTIIQMAAKQTQGWTCAWAQVASRSRPGTDDATMIERTLARVAAWEAGA